MASLSTSGDGKQTIQFIDTNGRRKSIRLGRLPRRIAEAIKLRIEALLAAKLANSSIDRDTSAWLGGISDDLADKLAAVGLIEVRDSSTLADFTASYIRRRTDIKPRTRINLEQCRKRLIDFFGANRSLRSISPGDADNWLLWLKERYADGTTGRAVKRARQFFRSAMRSKLIPSNPFDDVKPPSMVNESRKRFIDRPTIDRVLQACPDAEWRLIVALCRYGGLRCPSELLPLTWADVNWGRSRFYVRSPKTEHHEGGGGRWVPIFGELRPYLEDAFEQAEPGTVYLVRRYRSTNQNLRTQLQRICKRAGVEPWGKPFHNLRASRETELAAEYPLHVVCSWLGNTALIAAKHYLQVTDSDFLRAAKSGAARCSALQNPVQSVLDREGQERTQPDVGQRFCPSESIPVLSCPSVEMPLVGLEPTTH
jgi:integrase